LRCGAPDFLSAPSARFDSGVSQDEAISFHELAPSLNLWNPPGSNNHVDGSQRTMATIIPDNKDEARFGDYMHPKPAVARSISSGRTHQVHRKHWFAFVKVACLRGDGS
jgi:hypothetical protein